MSRLRLGAVAYLNARPLVHGLDRYQDRLELRFDVPSTCASLLHRHQIDLGLIPSIEYLHAPDYRIIPDIAIASDGPVASVALFSTRPITAVRTIALDSSSRTSVALLRVLCARFFDIEPKMIVGPPDLESMVREHDAALLIGDPALYADHEALGLEKIDLGEAWTTMTGQPFVWAFWAGRPASATRDDVRLLQVTRDESLANLEAVAGEFLKDDKEKIQQGADYLRNNIRYHLRDRECTGLRRFYETAAEVGLVHRGERLRFFD